jgi:hypothetical protein
MESFKIRLVSKDRDNVLQTIEYSMLADNFTDACKIMLDMHIPDDMTLIEVSINEIDITESVKGATK